MSPFEFLVSLYAIVAGLGLSLLIQSVGQMIEARDLREYYYRHSTWMHTLMLGVLALGITFVPRSIH